MSKLKQTCSDCGEKETKLTCSKFTCNKPICVDCRYKCWDCKRRFCISCSNLLNYCRRQCIGFSCCKTICKSCKKDMFDWSDDED